MDITEEEGKDLSNLRRAQRLTQCHCHVLSCLQRKETREREEEEEESSGSAAEVL